MEAWGGPLWPAADLITPMALRVAATLQVADAITGSDFRAGTRWPFGCSGRSAGPSAGSSRDRWISAPRRRGAYALTDADSGCATITRRWASIDLEARSGTLTCAWWSCCIRFAPASRPFPAFRARVPGPRRASRQAASYNALMGHQLAAEAPSVAAAYAGPRSARSSMSEAATGRC